MKKTICTIDAETDPFGSVDFPEPFIWGFFDGVQFLTFDHAEPMIEYLYNKHLIVYAHNGGKFDFHFLLDYIPAHTKPTVINGRLVKFKIGNCEFRDSYPLLNQPLSAFSKLEIDYNKMRKENREANMEEIITYLKYDCESLYNAVNAFIDGYGKHLTVPGSAINQIKLIEELKLPKQTEQRDAQLRNYYFGGRTQVFRYGLINEKSKMIDINSAYSRAMIEDHPFSETMETIPILRKYKGEKINCQAFYNIKCKTQKIGPFPLKVKNVGVTFPIVDTQTEFYVTGWELSKAIELNLCYDLYIETKIVFHETKNFKKFINHFYEIKKHAKKGSYDYIFAKLMQNSGYGKFSANPRKYREYEFIPINDIARYMEFCACNSGGIEIEENQLDFFGEYIEDCKGRFFTRCPSDDCDLIYHHERDFQHTALVSKKLSPDKWDRSFVNVAIGASITGFARAYLLDGIAQIINKGGSVLYCDTDSIFYTGELEFDNIGDELGQWELEGEYETGAIAGKKLYYFQAKNGECKIASKGTKLAIWDIRKLALDPDAFIDYSFMAPVYSLSKEPYNLSRKIKQT